MRPVDATDAAVTSPRKQRAMQIAEREDVLRKVISTADRQRSWAWNDERRKVPATEQEQAARVELRELTQERQALLAEVVEREKTLRAQQSAHDRGRGAVAAQRGKTPATKVTGAERKLRAEMSALASERAWLDGTVRRDRELGQMMEAVANTCAVPIDSSDW
jgi:hypothetical protein